MKSYTSKQSYDKAKKNIPKMPKIKTSIKKVISTKKVKNPSVMKNIMMKQRMV